MILLTLWGNLKLTIHSEQEKRQLRCQGHPRCPIERYKWHQWYKRGERTLSLIKQ